MISLASIIYPKQYIFLENDDKKIYKVINDVENAKPVDEYLWSPITTITEKKVDGTVYSLIQHEDERLGWVNLEKSIQILRHEPVYYKFIDQEFENHEPNVKMGNVKDYRVQFSNKILTVKSEIEYNGEILLGVFIKNKFSGFHPKNYFEKMIECNIEIPIEVIKDKKLYKLSSLNKIYDNKIFYNRPKLITIYKQNNLGRVKVNSKEFFWTTLDGLENYITDYNNNEESLSPEQKLYDDIVYGINLERQHSKEMLKTVLDARKYLNSKKAKEKDFRIKRLESSFKNAKAKNEAFQNTILKLEEEVKNLKKDKPITKQQDLQLNKPNQKLKTENKNLKNEILDLKRSLRKLENSNDLSNKRLEHQKEYNERLEAQKNKYKNRMNLVEERMNKLMQKNDSVD